MIPETGEERKTETETDREKSSLPNAAEAIARVSKEIEMRYFSFLKFF